MDLCAGALQAKDHAAEVDHLGAVGGDGESRSRFVSAPAG